MFSSYCASRIFLCLYFFVIPSSSFVDFVHRKAITTEGKARVGMLGMSSTNQSFQTTVTLTSAATQKALAAAEQEASSNGWKVTIAIADAGGTPLLVKRCDGAFAASYEIAVGKAKTAAQFCKNTGQLEAAVNVADGSSRTALLSAPFVLMRGGVPIFVNGVCCGAVGVSGVKPEEDEQVAMAAINDLNVTISKL